MDFLKKLFNFQPDESPSKEGEFHPEHPPATAEECHYDVKWSEEDDAYVATVKEFPSLSWIDDNPDKALRKLRILVADTINEVDYDQP